MLPKHRATKTYNENVILSQFNHCPRVWMFCDHTLDSKINRIDEIELRIALQNKASDFNTILIEANSVYTQKKPAVANGCN